MQFSASNKVSILKYLSKLSIDFFYGINQFSYNALTYFKAKYEENCRMGDPKDLQYVRTCEANHKCVYASYASDSVEEILNTTGKCIDNDSYSKTEMMIILPHKG